MCLQELASLHCIQAGKPVKDGAYIVQSNIVRELKRHGHRLTFLASGDAEEIECTGDLDRVQFAPRTWSSSFVFNELGKNTWRLQRLLRIPYLSVFSNYRLYDACLQCLPGQDVVYERNALYSAGVAMACRKLALPYVMFFDADQLMELEYLGKPVQGLLRRRAVSLLTYNLKAANCIICVSEEAKANLVTRWDADPAKVLVFPNGVDVQLFCPDSAARARTRAELGVTAEPLIIFTGSFFQWHDLPTLLDAFARILSGYPGARLLLVGDGAERSVLMQKAREMELNDSVLFTGSLPQARLPQLLAAADIAVAPYPVLQHEFWLSPLKVFEYMSSGTAVVASAVGQVTRVIQNQVNGLLVPPGDAAALAVALKSLIAEPARARQLGERARADAVARYSWDRYVSRLEQLFLAVMSHASFGDI